MKDKNHPKRGFIQITIIIIGALVVLKYAYNLDVVGFLTTGKFRLWLDKIYDLGNIGWEKYHEIIIKSWNYILNFIKDRLAK